MERIKCSKNPSLLFVDNNVLDKNLIKKLNSLNFSENGTRRLCFHASNESPLHAMAVQTPAGEVFSRHAHLDSDELIVIIKGELRVRIWLYEDDEEPAVYFLGNDLSRCDCAAIFIPRETFHDTMAVHNDTVYLESKLGPFNAESTVHKLV